MQPGVDQSPDPVGESPHPAVAGRERTEPVPGSAARPARWSNAGGWAVPLLLVVLFVVFSIASPDTFFTLSNVRAVISGQGTIVVLAMAVLIPLRGGDFDLSVPSVMIVTGCAVGSLTAHGWPAGAACLVAFLVGPVVGFVNGVLVVKFGIDSLISTLGMLTILEGIATLISHETLISTIPAGLSDFASHKFFGLPTPVWLGWLLALVLWYMFELTPWGRYLLFIGGNRNSAYLAGLRVDALRLVSFVISGSLGAVAGLLFAGYLGSVDPTAAGSYLLPPITAAFLGASAIKLGRFNVAGTLVAIYLLAVGITGFQLLGVSDWITDVFDGACLIGAVGFSILFRRRAAG